MLLSVFSLQHIPRVSPGGLWSFSSSRPLTRFLPSSPHCPVELKLRKACMYVNMKTAFRDLILQHWFLLPVLTDSIHQKTLSVESNNGSRARGKGSRGLGLRVHGKNGMDLSVCAMRREASGKVQYCFVQWENSVVALTTSCIRNVDYYLTFLILNGRKNGWVLSLVLCIDTCAIS